MRSSPVSSLGYHCHLCLSARWHACSAHHVHCASCILQASPLTHNMVLTQFRWSVIAKRLCWIEQNFALSLGTCMQSCAGSADASPRQRYLVSRCHQRASQIIHIDAHAFCHEHRVCMQGQKTDKESAGSSSEDDATIDMPKDGSQKGIVVHAHTDPPPVPFAGPAETYNRICAGASLQAIALFHAVLLVSSLGAAASLVPHAHVSCLILHHVHLLVQSLAAFWLQTGLAQKPCFLAVHRVTLHQLVCMHAPQVHYMRH